MSSETSTDTATFRPWHLFVLAGLLASTVGVVVVRPSDPVVLALLVAAIGSAAGVGLALYRALQPLTSRDDNMEQTPIVGGRTRAAIEREKTLVLRAIKELQFDRAMSKVSDEDFREMAGRLRSRALVLMQQLDTDMPGYRDMIEQELAERLRVTTESAGADDDFGISAAAAVQCSGCGTENDGDARFCKGCGSSLEAST